MTNKESRLDEIKLILEKASKDERLSKRYVKKAKRLAMHFKVKLPKEIKRKFCKYCFSLFKGGNYKVRTSKKKLIIQCLECKKYTRFKIS